MNERIKELRTTLKLSQTEFAKSVMISQNAISNLETGKVTPLKSTVARICDKFNVNELWLNEGKGEIFKSPRKFDKLLKLIEKLTPTQEMAICGIAEMMLETGKDFSGATEKK